MQTCPSIVFRALRRAPISILKRNKVSLEKFQVVDTAFHREKFAARELLPHGVSLKKAVNTVLHDVKDGDMDYAVWGQCRKLIIYACEHNKPELATQILNRMIREQLLSGQQAPKLSARDFNIIINAWTKLRQPEQAENAFKQMLSSHAQNPSQVEPPDLRSYNSLLAAWAASGSPDAVNRVLEILEEMESSEDMNPDTYTYNTVMASYANLVEEYGAAKAAEDILLRFSERHTQGKIAEGPQTVSFNIVIKAWSNSGDEKGADRAHKVFSLMEKLHEEGHEDIKPNVISLVTLMNAYAKEGDLEMVEKLLHTADVDGDLTNCYHCAISAYAKVGHANAGDRAEEILTKMKDPIEDTYKIVMQAHASANRPDAANRCEDFLGRAVEDYLKYKSDIRPQKSFFKVALDAWLDHHNQEEAAERASALVKDMIGLTKEWKMQTKPDEKIVDILIELWSRVNAEKGYEILGYFEKQDIIPWRNSYNTVIRAFNLKRNSGSIQKVLELLHRLESRGMAGTSNYNEVLFGLSKHPNVRARNRSLEILQVMEDAFQKGDKGKGPNSRTYATVLYTLSSHASGDDIAIAMDIFRRMVQLEKDPESRGIDRGGYTAILLFLSRIKHHESADTATDIFNRIPEPNGAHVSSAILANARSFTEMHALTAYNLLLKTSRLFLAGKLKDPPNPSAFCAVLRALSKVNNIHTDSVKRAYKILDLIKEMKFNALQHADIYILFFDTLARDTNNNSGIEAEKILHSIPNRNTALWNSVLKVWSSSWHVDKVFETQRFLREMQDANIKLDIVSYNAVLLAAATSAKMSPEIKEKTFKIALETLEELKHSENIQPDNFSYCNMIRCYRTLVQPSQERINSIQEMFEECKKKGEVGSICLEELHRALPPADFEKCTGINAGKTNLKKEMPNIPIDWKFNIIERGKHNQNRKRAGSSKKSEFFRF